MISQIGKSAYYPAHTPLWETDIQSISDGVLDGNIWGYSEEDRVIAILEDPSGLERAVDLLEVIRDRSFEVGPLLGSQIIKPFRNVKVGEIVYVTFLISYHQQTACKVKAIQLRSMGCPKITDNVIANVESVSDNRSIHSSVRVQLAMNGERVVSVPIQVIRPDAVKVGDLCRVIWSGMRDFDPDWHSSKEYTIQKLEISTPKHEWRRA